ncbi:lysylphosphatidylglycerol synthase transmembrane domain-containing protein [Terracoccus sp. 273MFTsu3.1]|uniref:lysylphosphatidylglycerol synthase transmembrane domain-containing protein n=1 Tax=Terracoccus sp. 273MFTsu3.1 TaxID=1172188 RepID=UPI00036CCCF2|nr:lysylphosphatidylglycerol synthase transmembrane domain-containing protein [Terracoccus sp. 273MFTsu3.1]
MQRDRAWLRPLAGLVILGVLVWRVGGGAFVDGLRHVDARSVAAAAAIAVVTTICGAWRWVLVARGLGSELSLRAAVAACYRSQFLNVTLPGGVLGDVHRGVRHGRDGGDVGRGVRSVVWERSAGQVVLLGLTLGAVLLLPSRLQPVGSPVATTVLVAVTAALLGVVVTRRLGSGRAPAVRPGPLAWVSQVLRVAAGDVRHGLLGRHTWPGVVVVSALVVVGHVATFVLAARSAGVEAPVGDLVPLALVVLVAMALPLNVAGWGPREGVAAWVFGMSGLGVAGGVATAVVYGVMSFVAALPGAALLVVSRRGGSRTPTEPTPEGAVRG